jgi:protein-L-isoaspartate(D-aspartate) O-methyltransferase
MRVMRDDSHDEALIARLRMVDEQLRARGIRDPRLLAAMAEVPRHEFIDKRYWSEAYSDHPLPIASGQTISQPYIVAAMIEALQVAPHHRVLEIGTGTGYEAAILSRLAQAVYTVERHPDLAEEARQIFQHIGYRNIAVFTGDGSEGLPQHAPYDRTIVAAAAPEVPQALWEELAENGRLVLPVGNYESQVLQLITRNNGLRTTSTLDACRFVPLIGTSGFDSN